MRQTILGIAVFASVSVPAYGQVVEFQPITDSTEIPARLPKGIASYKIVRSDYEQSKRSQPQVGDFAVVSRPNGKLTDSPISMVLFRPSTGRYLVWRSVKGEAAANGTYLLAANTSTILASPGTASTSSSLQPTVVAKEGAIGIGLAPIPSYVRNDLKLPSGQGVILEAIYQGSPAAQAGLKIGDILLSVNDTSVVGADGISKIVKPLPEGSSLKISAIRNGLSFSADVIVSDKAKLAPLPLVQGSGLVLVASQLVQDGSSNGAYLTAKLYEAGHGYARNPAQARAWKQRAAAGGQPDAIREISAAQVATAPKKKSGLFGALVGAAGGALGVAALGGDGAAMLDAASQMANMVSPNTTGGSTVSAITGTLSGKPISTPSVSGGGKGVVTPGSFQTKPNLADSPACEGFTEDNYRQVALSGGLDVQLKTMCGQAFEYYTMYKRAIAQGYSEADSNRTYAAHEQSALVANSFYANNRAR